MAAIVTATSCSRSSRSRRSTPTGAVGLSFSELLQRQVTRAQEVAAYDLLYLGEMDTQCGHDTAEFMVQREETAERVQRILRTLPKAQYEVIILKHWEDLTFAEIADVLGKSQNTVASSAPNNRVT